MTKPTPTREQKLAAYIYVEGKPPLERTMGLDWVEGRFNPDIGAWPSLLELAQLLAEREHVASELAWEMGAHDATACQPGEALVNPFKLGHSRGARKKAKPRKAKKRSRK